MEMDASTLRTFKIRLLRPHEAQVLDGQYVLREDPGRVEGVEDISCEGRGNQTMLLRDCSKILHHIPRRIRLTSGPVSGKTPARAEQPYDTISGLLNERSSSWHIDAISGRVRNAQCFQTPPPRGEDDIHNFHKGLILDAAKM